MRDRLVTRPEVPVSRRGGNHGAGAGRAGEMRDLHHRIRIIGFARGLMRVIGGRAVELGPYAEGIAADEPVAVMVSVTSHLGDTTFSISHERRRLARRTHDEVYRPPIRPRTVCLR